MGIYALIISAIHIYAEKCLTDKHINFAHKKI